jgi:hypothetical protein
VSNCIRASDARAAAATFGGVNPLNSGCRATLVATMTSSRTPRLRTQRPTIVSDSPPTFPGAQ